MYLLLIYSYFFFPQKHSPLFFGSKEKWKKRNCDLSFWIDKFWVRSLNFLKRSQRKFQALASLRICSDSSAMVGRNTEIQNAIFAFNRRRMKYVGKARAMSVKNFLWAQNRKFSEERSACHQYLHQARLSFVTFIS